MSILRTARGTPLDVGLALLRVIAGVVFTAHGAQKLFSFGLSGVIGAFGQMGVPLAGVVGPAVAILEFVGGIALIAGLLTRPVALGLGLVMLGALFTVHLPGGFFLPNGIEFVLTLFGAATLFTLVGGGEYSVDAVLAKRHVAGVERHAPAPVAPGTSVDQAA